MDIKHKKAIVFGGTSGIGLAAAKQLAAAGAEVVIVSRNPDKAGSLPDGISVKSCDVRDEEAISDLFKECAPFDILISSATGGSRAAGPFMEMEMGTFRSSFDKLWGYANVVRFGVPHMSETGSVVLVSGTPARRPKPHQIALAAVGSAVEAMSRSLATQIAPRRINVVAPGFIDTPMVALKGKEREENYKKVTATHAIPRVGTADEAAQAIMFLIQNDFVTGTTVDVDGGWLLA